MTIYKFTTPIAFKLKVRLFFTHFLILWKMHTNIITKETCTIRCRSYNL